MSNATAPVDIKRMPVAIRPEGSIAPISNPMFKGDPPYTGAWAEAAYDPETPGPLYHPGTRARTPARALPLDTLSPCHRSAPLPPQTKSMLSLIHI